MDDKDQFLDREKIDIQNGALKGVTVRVDKILGCKSVVFELSGNKIPRYFMDIDKGSEKTDDVGQYVVTIDHVTVHNHRSEDNSNCSNASFRVKARKKVFWFI